MFFQKRKEDRSRGLILLRRRTANFFLIVLSWVVASLSLSTVVQASETSLWKVVKGERQIYIGATVHALSESDYPLPAQFDRAYEQASELVVESDRGLTLTRQGRNRLLYHARIRDGSTLKDRLKPETWRALESFLNQRDVPVERLDQYQPGMLTVMLTMVQKQSLKPVVDGVEAHYLGRALVDGKSVDSFETLVEQIIFFSTLGSDDPDSVVLHALDEARQKQASLDAMVAAWRVGDVRWIEQNPMAAIRSYPDIYKAVLVERNNAWLPKIEALLDSEPIEFVLVGALHLAGPDSLIAKLRAKGYRIQKL